jgi:hypothetical protein
MKNGIEEYKIKTIRGTKGTNIHCACIFHVDAKKENFKEKGANQCWAFPRFFPWELLEDYETWHHQKPENLSDTINNFCSSKFYIHIVRIEERRGEMKEKFFFTSTPLAFIHANKIRKIFPQCLTLQLKTINLWLYPHSCLLCLFHLLPMASSSLYHIKTYPIPLLYIVLLIIVISIRVGCVCVCN